MLLVFAQLQSLPVEEQMRVVHQQLQEEWPDIKRVSVSVYDASTDGLKTWGDSSERGAELASNWSSRVALGALALTGKDIVIDELLSHSTLAGSSYTCPLFKGESVMGFVSFDAAPSAFFVPPTVRRLKVYVELLSALLESTLLPSAGLRSAIEAVSELSHSRDPETGKHLDRMQQYSRLIARELAHRHHLTDTFVENICAFAPLHDVGKVSIPDRVLLKPGPLDEAEMKVMRTHSMKGLETVDRLLARLGNVSTAQTRLVRNIVRHHHEAFDGSGYPDGLKGTEIPLEARVVQAADVFDALTSPRPYKRAWDTADAFAQMRGPSARTFDPDCLDALWRAQLEVERIRLKFADEEQHARASPPYPTSH